eukprot:1944369-Alexandrium_andersonii.AAC.1
MVAGDFNSNLCAVTREEADRGDTAASLLEELIAGNSLRSPAKPFLKRMEDRATHRAPGVNHPTKESRVGYSGICFVLVASRWASMAKDYKVGQQAPLNSDRFPAVVKVAVRLASEKEFIKPLI